MSTATVTFNAGTIDFTAPCGSGCPDCPGCCGITTPCCVNSFPTTLHATVANVLQCACADGEVIVLTYNSGANAWQGSGTMTCIASGQIILKFYCDGTIFRLDATFCAHTDIGLSGATGHCNPINYQFAIGTDPGCCDGLGPGNLNVIITA